jgi:site-specific recombinase XerD
LVPLSAQTPFCEFTKFPGPSNRLTKEVHHSSSSALATDDQAYYIVHQKSTQPSPLDYQPANHPKVLSQAFVRRDVFPSCQPNLHLPTLRDHPRFRIPRFNFLSQLMRSTTMHHELALSPDAPGSDLEALIRKAAQYAENSRSKATRMGYASDLRDFCAFCSKYNLPYLSSTPQAVSLYISDLASRGLTVATIKRRLAAIGHLHKQAGCVDSPASAQKHFVLREVLAGIKRTLGTAQRGAEPLLSDAIRRMVAACPGNLLGQRDRALLLIGFAAGARREFLASILEVRDLTFTGQGDSADLYIRMRRGKADQEQSGETIAIVQGQHPETDPVGALKAWLAAARIESGPVFRAVDRHGNVSSTALSARSVSKILKAATARAGMDPTQISPHGLRSGMCTQAALNGAEERDIARTTLHKSVAMVRRYIRDADLLRNNASGRLGL